MSLVLNHMISMHPKVEILIDSRNRTIPQGKEMMKQQRQNASSTSQKMKVWCIFTSPFRYT